MALASEQANTPSSASFAGVHSHWGLLEDGITEAIITKALPVLQHDLYHERYHQNKQLPLGCSGQDHVWGKFVSVPHTNGMLQWLGGLQEWELINL